MFSARTRMDDAEHVFATGHARAVDPETGKRTTDSPIINWARPKEKLDQISGVTGWRLHDIRRTVVTGMNEKLRIEPHVVESVVGHVSGAAKRGVAGTYNRAQYLEQRTAALEAWGRYLLALVGEASEDNVIDLRGAK